MNTRFASPEMSSQAVVKEASNEVIMVNYPITKDAKISNISEPSAVETLLPTTDADPRLFSTISRQRIFKIIVVGDSGVGKTCLTLRFCIGKFPEKTEATIGVDFREKNLDVGGESLKIQIWDTAGQERFRQSMVPHYYRNVHAVVYVYDVTKRLSFENLTSWIEECNRNQLGPEVPRILIGNKCDAIGSQDVVLTQEAQCFADRHSMPLFETSAKDDSASDHVESIFLTVAHKLKNSRPMMRSTVSQFALETYEIQKLMTSPNSTECVPGQKDGSKCFC